MTASPSSLSPEFMESDSSSSHKPTWLERLTALLSRQPEDRDELIEILHGAYDRNLMDADALGMIEGVLQVGEMQVREVMVPRAQMDVIDIHDSPESFLPAVIEVAHSRFPVIDRDRDDIIGILLAKDLLAYFAGQETDIRDMLRPAVFIPESKRLNVLLKEFRASRNHMAIVVDEYGGVAGLVTIEDVLEQIVGDIEDEYDFDEAEDQIVRDRTGRYRVKANTEIEDFNTVMGTQFSDDVFDTIGGLVISHFGHLPKRGEIVVIEGVRFQIMRADSRRVHTLTVDRAVRTVSQETPASVS
jgi:magnesium and cobalt transporter